MKKFLIDTDVLIDYLRNVQESISFLEKTITISTCYVSAITVAELYAGVREGNERRVLEDILQIFKFIPVDSHISREGGIYRRNYHKTHGVGLPDAIIAASAEYQQAILVTLNKKHFPMLKNVMTPYKKS